jgi:hypothetical protein
MEFLSANAVVILTALLAVSEVLALIPGVKSSSVLQLIVNGVKSLLALVKPKPPEVQ